MPKFGSPIDLTTQELRNAVIQTLSADPGTGKRGQIYYNTTSDQLRVCTNAVGPVWSILTTGTTPAATAGALGTVQLAGDLAGTGSTATAPTVGSLHLTADTAIGHKLTSVTDPGSAQDAATKNYVDTRSLSNFTAPTADLAIGSHKLTGVTDPTSAQDAATKAYVDNVAQGLNPKPSARAATTGAETFTVVSGSVTVIAGTALDGVSPAIGDRILIKDAPAASGVGSAGSTQPGNGLYIVTNATTNLTVSRDTSMDDANDPPAGAFVFVEAGTVAGAAGFVVSTPSSSAAFTYGTNNIAWTQFSGAGEIIAGTGLAKSGNTLSIENSGVLLPAHGGTGVASPTAHGVLVAEGASAAVAVAPSATSGLPLVSNGASADPSFGAVILTATGAVSGALPLANGGTAATSAAAARTSLAAGAVDTTTLASGSASYTFTPAPAPKTAGAWQVTLINQSTGAIEYADVVINQALNTPVTGPVNQITVTFSAATAVNYTLIAEG